MKNIRYTSSKILISLTLLSLLSCSYTFQGSGSILPPDVKKIYIPRVENASSEPGISTVVTEALQDRFERYGVVNIVDGVRDADAILKVKILKVKRSTRSSTSSTDVALQQDTTLSVSGELTRTNGAVLWRDPNISLTKSFGVAQGVVVTSSADFSESALGATDLSTLNTREVSRGQEQQALQGIADDLANKIYDAAVAPEF